MIRGNLKHQLPVTNPPAELAAACEVVFTVVTTSSDFEQVVLGENGIIHGAGQITKACNQLALLVTAQGSAEALSLAARCGVDPAKVREVMLGGIAASRVLDLFGKRMVERDFATGIEARLYYKDLHIVLDLVHELGLAAPAAALAMQSVNALMSFTIIEQANARLHRSEPAVPGATPALFERTSLERGPDGGA